jgi:hypothetical protein
MEDGSHRHYPAWALCRRSITSFGDGGLTKFGDMHFEFFAYI